MKYELPDYNNCCVNLIASVSNYFGVDTGHNSLKIVDRELRKDYKNIVILLLDGMGQELISRKLSAESFIRQNFVQELSAVFPSSTTPATVSFKSGLTPVEHGWWGHFLYFKEVGSTVHLYLNTDAFSKRPMPFHHIAHSVMPYDTILDRIFEKTEEQVRCYALCNEGTRDTAGITQITYNTWEEMSNYIMTLTQNDGKKVLYVYNNLPDALMHDKGPYSPEVADLIAEMDAGLAYLCNNCPDTLFLVTADHGQVDIHEVRDIADYPDVMDCLIMPPNGLTRCFNFYIKPNRHKEFEKLINKYFSDKFVLFSKKQVLEMNLLGDGVPHFKVDDTLGDYLLIGIADSTLAVTTLYEQSIIQPLGNHGGLNKLEMRVPLIMFGDKINNK